RPAALQQRPGLGRARAGSGQRPRQDLPRPGRRHPRPNPAAGAAYRRRCRWRTPACRVRERAAHRYPHAWLEIVLDEGRNRQIRRLLAAFDLSVLRLVRVAIGPVGLGSLGKGQWRMLDPAERDALAPATAAGMPTA